MSENFYPRLAPKKKKSILQIKQTKKGALKTITSHSILDHEMCMLENFNTRDFLLIWILACVDHNRWSGSYIWVSHCVF